MIGQKSRSPSIPAGEVWLDISRLLYRIFRSKITGIDRVEIAYAEQLLNIMPEQARFVAYDYWRGAFRALPQPQTAELVRAIAPAWRDGAMRGLSRQSFKALLGSIFTAPAVPRYKGGPRASYINVSSHPLHLVDHVGSMMNRTGAIFIPLVPTTVRWNNPWNMCRPSGAASTASG